MFKPQSSLLAALLAAGAATPALAGAVVIWPVDPTITKDQRATALWVENQGSEPMTVQVRAFSWSQPEGKESLAEQDDVVASPPIATVAGGQRQLVRIIRRTPGAGPTPEQSYRLLIDELPPPPGAKTGDKSAAALSVQMRYSVPLFTYNADADAVTPDLQARVVAEGADRFLVLQNAGRKHARLVNLRVVKGEEKASVISGLVGYVLPGQTVRWPLPKDTQPNAAFEINVNGADRRLQAAA